MYVRVVPNKAQQVRVNASVSARLIRDQSSQNYLLRIRSYVVVAVELLL